MINLKESPAIPFVETTLPYIDATFGPTILYEYERGSTTHHYDPHPVRIHDARAVADGLSLERNGFTLVRHDTAVTDFRDADQIKQIYYPEIERLLRGLIGAEKVIVFGEALRSNDAGLQMREPAMNPHVDFNEKTVRRFARDILGAAEAEKYRDQRVVLINLWRGIAPVERLPLAVCDASTVTAADLTLGLIGHKPGDDFEFLEGFNVAYSPAHRWYYYPRMQPAELLVFKLCDSDGVRPQLTAHTAFDDPSSLPNAPPRQSLEIRTISFFSD